MEAPEKIYVDANESWLRTFVAFTDKAKGNDIEYIRTDAFIDKACSFLKSYRQETPDGMGYIAGIVNDKTIEDFRKAMQDV